MKPWLSLTLVLFACSSGTTGSSGGSGGSSSDAGSGGSGGAGGTKVAADAAAGSGGSSDAASAQDVARAEAQAPAADAPVDRAGDLGAGTGPTLDQCFMGLRMLVGGSQVATRTSADGKYRMRLALETADRGGTSGSNGWEAVRFGLETPEGSVCVDEAGLSGAYKGSHHNCNDVLTVTAGGRRFVIQNPDSAIDYVDQTMWRRLAKLTIFSGATMTAGPIDMPTTRCDQASGDGKCRSGGPCQ